VHDTRYRVISAARMVRAARCMCDIDCWPRPVQETARRRRDRLTCETSDTVASGRGHASLIPVRVETGRHCFALYDHSH